MRHKTFSCSTFLLVLERASFDVEKRKNIVQKMQFSQEILQYYLQNFIFSKLNKIRDIYPYDASILNKVF